MKLLLALMMTMAVSGNGYLQKNPVHWEFSAIKTGDKTYEIHFTPTVKSPWHIYSQTSPEGAGAPTKFSFNKNPLVKLGKVNEIGTIVSKYEEVFDVTTKYFKGKSDFVLVVQLKAKVKTNLSGSVEYMACTDEECLPPDVVPFTIKLE